MKLVMNTATETQPNARLCDALNRTLAETAVTTMMAQYFHWNVKGMHFMQLHQLFQDIYEDHFAAQDDLAERIKAIDGTADGHLGRMLERSGVEEHSGDMDERAMLQTLLFAQETIAASLKETGELAASSGDTLTEDLCIARGQTHEKFAWFLRMHLE
jgi:starvation-inducible DNA-binding protein